MSHQVFVDKMLSVLSTPMVFLKESSFVFASNGRRWHWCLCSRGALTASLFARSKQEHPTPNKNTLPKQRHPTQTTTTLKQEHPTPNQDTLPKQRHPTQTTTTLKQEHPTPNKNTLLKQRHPTQTTTTPKPGHPARTRTSSPNEDTRPNEAVWKIFVKFAGITGLRK